MVTYGHRWTESVPPEAGKTVGPADVLPVENQYNTVLQLRKAKSCIGPWASVEMVRNWGTWDDQVHTRVRSPKIYRDDIDNIKSELKRRCVEKMKRNTQQILYCTNVWIDFGDRCGCELTMRGELLASVSAVKYGVGKQRAENRVAETIEVLSDVGYTQ